MEGKARWCGIGLFVPPLRLWLERHADKTFVGRAAKGFDFLGYRLSPKGLTVGKQTRQRFALRAARLQERERSGRAPPGALGVYVQRWQRWATAGLAGARWTRPECDDWWPVSPGFGYEAVRRTRWDWLRTKTPAIPSPAR